MNNYSLVDNFFLFFFSWSQGANVAFLTQWRMFEFEIGGCSCFCFFVTSFFSTGISRAQWQTSDFLSVSGSVCYRAYPISVSDNPFWKLKCSCCWLHGMAAFKKLCDKELFGTLKWFLNSKCSLSLWCKLAIGHGKWFLNTNLFLIKTFLITKFDCTYIFKYFNSSILFRKWLRNFP